ncbi:MAG: carbohydrate binding domain-containing protein [Bacteroidales bacterium]|jgi:glucuronoarabinoxylan endo-1,4-beta-xylanase|nr:carbohydrate binding domain-containing protein [Bacteroidales bacterium]
MKKSALFVCSLFYIFYGFSQNMIDNGNFENDYEKWNRLTGTNGAMSFYSLDLAVVYDGAQSMRVSTKSVGDNPWDNQMVHDGFYPKKDEEYKLRFFASSKEGEVDIKAVIQNTTYSEKIFTITPEWKEYEWTFTAQEDYLQLKFFFHTLGTVYLDNIAIIDKNYKPVHVLSTDTLIVDYAVHHQKIEGFGAALAFYENWITDHPSKEEMYRLAFQDLGLDWLRIRNDYKYTNNYAEFSKEFVDKAKQWRGDSIRILMCGWSPPADLKSNNDVNNGTLKKDENGFVYQQYADYWKEALLAYQEAGIYPDWLSIQNEPDWLTDKWETCKFTPTETEQYPGYDKAFAEVMKKFADIEQKPLMLGSEMLGIGNNQFYAYNSPLKDNPNLFAYAYHLYNGGDPEKPDSYNAALQNIKKDFSNKPNVMTEFEHRKGKWYKTSWLMNNLLTEANLTAYFYWDLIWPNAGLIDIDNPYDKGGWRNVKGFQKTEHYYAFKHFSKFLDAGDVRVEHQNSNNFLRSSAYMSADSTLTIVIINPTETEITSTLQIPHFARKSSEIIQSVSDNFFALLGKIPADNRLVLPPESVTTIVMKK